MRRLARFAVWMILLKTLSAQAQVTALEPLVSGLDQPLFLTNAHDGSDRKFVVEQSGRILVLQANSSSASVYLNIRDRVLSGGEQGLLGLAFHPQYSVNGRFFVDYTRQSDGATVIAEYHVSVANPNLADAASESVVLIIPQPYSNHNGGMVAFGPDNYLYIGMGDGGAGNDPENRAQNINELLGKILRIDVDHAASPTVPYSSPSSNPFFGPADGRDEIFALGLRNPWRFSFDRISGQLVVGDVGQSTREEVDIVTNGGNYGWRVMEGTQCTGLGPPSCATFQSVPPVTEYVTAQAGRCAVTGGYVYRGSRQSLPYGAYVFGDFCSGEIFLLKDGQQSVILDTNLSISSFGEDESGEVYVVDLGGSISRITGAPSPGITQRRYVAPNRGGVSLTASGAGSSSLVNGYARIRADRGEVLPNSLAIVVWHQNGILVSETTIPATALVQSGRVFAVASASAATGLVMANPNAFPVKVDFNFTNLDGFDFGFGTTTIPSNGQISAFLSESPFSGGPAINGTFTFRATGFVSVAAVLGAYNERSDFLMSTLPVVPINATILDGIAIPFWIHGGDFKSEFILVNPSDVFIAGVINLLDPNGQAVGTLGYAIQPRSSQRLSPTINGSTSQSGSARIVSGGGALPSVVELVSMSTSAGTVTQTAVPAIAPAFEFLGYGEFTATTRSAIAVTNMTSAPTTVNVELRNLDGTLRDRGSIDLPASGERALFLDEVAGMILAAPFQGAVRLSSVSQIAVTALRTRTNERGEFLINATPPTVVTDPVSTSTTELFFPQLVFGGGADTQFILINPKVGEAASGSLNFLSQNGQVLPVMVP